MNSERLTDFPTGCVIQEERTESGVEYVDTALENNFVVMGLEGI